MEINRKQRKRVYEDKDEWGCEDRGKWRSRTRVADPQIIERKVKVKKKKKKKKKQKKLIIYFNKSWYKTKIKSELWSTVIFLHCFLIVKIIQYLNKLNLLMYIMKRLFSTIIIKL